ncbi:lysosomal cholesterol signaling protein-like isoform X2 [Babylonia areolata]|uniref:lysosomal cholesterol signaling protein-like isoform X2 n=1 Tax=Babylonia areolata TaxID=304850 RepID=UPI003FD44D0C
MGHDTYQTSALPSLVSTTPLSNSTGSGRGSVNFDNLVPALVQCFVVIMCGYVAGKAGHVSQAQGKGIANFLSTFCLPAMLFRAMCSLDFSQVNWNFLLAILIAKMTMFVVVVVVTVLVKRPLSLGHAGLLGIFVTQSNDFALGYPLIQALYQDSHPDFINYIYLISPISLLIINPIGFTLLEIHQHLNPHTPTTCTESGGGGAPNPPPSSSVVQGRRQRQDSTRSTGSVRSDGAAAGGERTWRRGLWVVVKGVLGNPIVYMTAAGLVGNLAFRHHVPSLLDNALALLGEAFSGTALFYLGLSMVGKVKTPFGKALIVPMLLIFAKSLLLPMVTWEVTSWLQGDAVIRSELSMYAFLYGTFPAAPAVVIFAAQYSLAQDLVTRGLVIGTILSAPMMFASAKMMSLAVSSNTEYYSTLLKASFDVSIVSIVSCVYVLGTFVFSGRWRRVPHRFTLCLILSQMVGCVGMVMHRALGEVEGWGYMVQFVVLLLGVFSARCWTAALAVAMCLLHIRGLCWVLKAQVWLALFGFGLPMVMTGLLFLLGAENITDEIDPSFHYGFMQTLMSAVVLAVCLVVTLVSVVIWQRSAHQQQAARSPPYTPIIPQTPSLAVEGEGGSSVQVEENGGPGSPPVPSRNNNTNNYQACGNSRPSCGSIEDILPFPSLATTHTHTPRSDASSSQAEEDEGMVEGGGGRGAVNPIDERTCLLSQCSAEERRECRQRLRRYAAASGEDSWGGDVQDEEGLDPTQALKEEYQTTHHLLLLLLLAASMFVGLFLCLWRLITNQASGISVEVEFLDSFFNYGQAFVVLAIFGFDTRLVFSPLMRRLRRWWYGAELVHLPDSCELDEETRTTCHQFLSFHLNTCRSQICRDGRFRLRRYQNVFTGAELCQWLMDAGLVEDQGEAVRYGRRLLLGRVISHVSGVHHFSCSRFFYAFVDSDDVEV